MARLFNGKSDFLERNAQVLAGTPLAIACWIYPTSSVISRRLVTLNENGVLDNIVALICRSSNGKLCAQQFTTSNNGLAQGTTPTLNTWQHGCAILSGDARRSVYLNNGGKVTDTSTVNAVTTTNLSIGRNDFGLSGGEYYSGRMAEVGIWDLSSYGAGATDRETAFEAVLADLAAGYAPSNFATGLVAYYPMLTADATETDATGNGHDLTATGTTLADHPPGIIYPGGSGPRIGRLHPIRIGPFGTAIG